MTVRIADLTITEASAEMHTFPHAECPGITEAFADLAGLSVTQGLHPGGPAPVRRAPGLHPPRAAGPLARPGGGAGGHLPSGPAVADGEAADLLSGNGSPWARDSCHIWAEDGVADQKLAAGWRPGIGPYPAPAVVTFREGGTAR